MILEALSATRDLGRLHEIAMILVRNGLGDAIRRLGIAPFLESAGRVIHWKAIKNLDKPTEVRLREALEELGPSFVKFGQILAGRIELLPPEWTAELERLHERAQAVPLEEIRAQLIEDLGAEPEQVFAEFDEEPLASASIAQVHRARLQDGTQVVLKIRRPGIRAVVEADLRIMTRLADLVEERLPELRRFRPQSLVRHFGHNLKDELDLSLEAKNSERLRSQLDAAGRIVIPRVHPQWTQERLCVLDFLEGPSVGEWVRAGKEPSIDCAEIASLGARTVLQQVFVSGCFHGDPHPGNILFLTDGRVGLIDFGLVGYLSPARRTEFLGLLLGVVKRDVEMVVEILISWSDGIVDTGPLSNDCSALIDRYNGPALKNLNTSEMLTDLMALFRDHHLMLPNDVAMLIKVFLTLEGTARLVDPDFVIATHMEPFARRAWREQHSPVFLMRRALREVSSLLTKLPGDLRQLTSQAKRGQLQLRLEMEGLNQLSQRMERSANRLSVGIVVAALIIGTSISLTVAGGPELFGLPLFGSLGFGSSLLVGVWLLWSILRSGRP